MSIRDLLLTALDVTESNTDQTVYGEFTVRNKTKAQLTPIFLLFYRSANICCNDRSTANTRLDFKFCFFKNWKQAASMVTQLLAMFSSIQDGRLTHRSPILHGKVEMEC